MSAFCNPETPCACPPMVVVVMRITAIRMRASVFDTDFINGSTVCGGIIKIILHNLLPVITALYSKVIGTVLL